MATTTKKSPKKPIAQKDVNPEVDDGSAPAPKRAVRPKKSLAKKLDGKRL
jgi:hypothetical protein